MSKQLLTLGIVLSLGTMGCAGVGPQQGSTHTAHAANEHGLDKLWSPADPPPSQGLEATRYVEPGLGSLWGSGSDAATSAGVARSVERRTGGDLWNPATVTRTWEVLEAGEPARPSEGFAFSDSSRSKRVGRRIAAQ